MNLFALLFSLTVVIDRPSPDAVADFRYHVAKMGASAKVDVTCAEHPYAVTDETAEAFRLKILGDKAWVSGRSAEAVSHGLYELLERMGCDWVMPGEIGEVIPNCPDPHPAEADVSESPSFAIRCPWYSGGLKKVSKRDHAVYEQWKVRKKLQRQREGHHPLYMNGGHVWQLIVRRNQAEFDAHPEMYALVRQIDGTMKRTGPQMELTHPRVIELVEDYIRGEFKRNKWPNDAKVCLSVGPADGPGFSESAESRNLLGAGLIDPIRGQEDQTDALVYLCNTLLERTKDEFPNLHLGFYLYGVHGEYPRRFKPDPRVVIVVADINFSRLHSTLEPIPTRRYYKSIMDRWAELANVKFFRGYNWNLADSFLPFSKLKMWADDIPYYHRMNYRGIHNESAMSWVNLGPSNYYEAEILWDVTRDWHESLDKYCRHAFGAGAPFLADYYTRITERQSAAKVEAGSFHGYHLIYDEAFVRSAQELFEKAAAAAVGEAENERIRLARIPLDGLGEFLRMRQLQMSFEFAAAQKLLDDMLAKRDALFDEHRQLVGFDASFMLRRFFVKPLEESVRYSTGDYRIVHRLPDAMTTVFDPYDRGYELGFADPEIADGGFLRTKTYSTPWTVQGLSFLSSGSVWYRERLPSLPDEPIGLLIAGCDRTARVYVNGKYVGLGTGWAKPLAFDLTDFLHPGEGNFLAIQITRNGSSENGMGGIVYPSFLFAGPRLKERAPKLDLTERLLPGGAVEKVR